MGVGWNFRREHLRLATRVHYVITNGGDQPNVVPPNAAVWYYFREIDYDHIMNLWRIGDNMAKAATLMTDTTYTSRVLGTAWPGYFNKPIAEGHVRQHAQDRNAKVVGRRPGACEGISKRDEGSADRPGDEDFLCCAAPRTLNPISGEAGEEGQPTGGPSDDIGDISWNVPTVMLHLSLQHSRRPGT